MCFSLDFVLSFFFSPEVYVRVREVQKTCARHKSQSQYRSQILAFHMQKLPKKEVCLDRSGRATRLKSQNRLG